MGRNSFVIGLTGNIATGKTTVLSYLAGKGAHVVDADKLAHKTMVPDGAAYTKVVEAFGAGIVRSDGTIDRATLADIVFDNPAALETLEEIVHPATFELLRWDGLHTDAPVVVIEAIKLLESGRIVTLCDEIWVVTSSPERQLDRLINERRMSPEEARQRMAAQGSQAEKVARADYVIDNDGSLEELHAQLDQLWQHVEEAVAEKARRVA